MTRTGPAELLAHLQRAAFSQDRRATSVELVGAEVEFIPVMRETGRIAPIEAGDDPGTLAVLRSLAPGVGWHVSLSAKAGVPEVRLPHGGRITFEPGGQIEYSAPPRESLGELVADLHTVVARLQEALGSRGIDVVFAGIDPRNRIEEVPLLLAADRYQRMDAHFATIGSHGARMMRQTASVQICLDAGPDPLQRWRLLNALAPYLVAIFANSPVYEGEITGHQSYRRAVLGLLDQARTGLAYDRDDPVSGYCRFALGAAAILCGDADPPFQPFHRHYQSGTVGVQDWIDHLTTLFPEVRPRGYFEVRSIDAIAPRWYAAPLVLLRGLTSSVIAERTAVEIAGAPDAALLERAGRCGLLDRNIASRSRELFELALDACESSRLASLEDLRTAQAFFERYARLGRSPSCDTNGVLRVNVQGSPAGSGTEPAAGTAPGPAAV